MIDSTTNKTTIENSRAFYKNEVAPMIKEFFGQYESRIAVGLAGEGSDCFGYDDFMSRDHDFGTGVCLWITDEDNSLFGDELTERYNQLVGSRNKGLTLRLQERRGVMTIHDFYSNILGIDCNTEALVISENDWQNLDHACLATAVNGEVFRDDLGNFSAFRNLLLNYYPDRIWKIRIVNELHRYSAALQVNYARCMTRGDVVAARLCLMQGLDSIMKLFFLMKRVYPPYYKWTFRALTELDTEGVFTARIKELAVTAPNPDAWRSTPYHPSRPNYKDRIVSLAEEIGSELEWMLRDLHLIRKPGRYMELHVDEVLPETSDI